MKKVMIGYWQDVVCKFCGHKRKIHRKHTTPKNYSFWCNECKKEVPQKNK